MSAIKCRTVCIQLEFKKLKNRKTDRTVGLNCCIQLEQLSLVREKIHTKMMPWNVKIIKQLNYNIHSVPNRTNN